ncbi:MULTISPECIES: PAAR domain-containing protein [unclassified Solwaraspora]|uniref:PAAR domain-containing protein n=1 Tax=unclassified Solwaraspora TaxID=2627926 RepID=UPI00248C5252|nr:MULTISPECIES: PAAR domain-containing protein [unclassified Solwaraspora]WBB95250.1 PAAR domain-containing protein [Solwaraspora sp. WMMA2059]WBC20844.1 PAAR domain-containing protein [Solwaraspora sp. WMMA2080]WJK37023.1 PAAR domain-containing protein [Solwaraspora sp. WMMA2065]
MGQFAAKQGDRVNATDIHVVMVPGAPAPTPTPLPHPFTGIINGGLSADVKIMGKPAAVAGSTAENTPAHVPTAPGTSFQKQPSNTATLEGGSATVRINGKPAIRSGDLASTCNDPQDLPSGAVLATGTVTIG